MEGEEGGGGAELEDGWEDAEDQSIDVSRSSGLAQQQGGLSCGQKSLQQAEFAPVLLLFIHLQPICQLTNGLLITQAPGLEHFG